MLIFTNDEVERLLPMDICLGVLERAYAAWAQGRAVNRPRSDLYLPRPSGAETYVFKSMDGGLLDPPIAALRLNSDLIRWETGPRGVVKRKVPAAPGGTWVGLVLLFSGETGEPLAIAPDGVMQRLRVAATSALAARRLAREDAAVLGILGSGWQAGAHAPAMCAVRPIRAVRVYSPTPANREAFVKAMATQLGIPVEAVESPEQVARVADILVTATNSIGQVVRPEWMRAGVHLTCVKASELGDDTIARADRVVIHTRRDAPENYIAGLGDDPILAHDPIGLLEKTAAAAPPGPPHAWLASPELKDLIGGTAEGRQSPEETTCFINNIGVGLQFAALGAALLEQARVTGAGREIPTEWFVEQVHP